MNCEICISFERSLRDLEAGLRDTITQCQQANRQIESGEAEPRERMEAALSEFFRQRGLYDHHRRRAHAGKSPITNLGGCLETLS